MDINHDHHAVEAYLKQVAVDTGNLALRGLRRGFMGYKPGTPMLLSYEAVVPQASTLLFFKRPIAFDVEANRVINPMRMGVISGKTELGEKGSLFVPVQKGLEVSYYADGLTDSVVYDKGKVVPHDQLAHFYQIIGDAQIPSLVDLIEHKVLFSGTDPRLTLFIGLAANRYLLNTGLREMFSGHNFDPEWEPFFDNFLNDYI